MNDCITTVTDKIIVFPDKKSKCVFIIINDQQQAIEKHKVDGCLIKGEDSNKCDWLAVDVATRNEVYIELKGKDVEHAVKQLCASVDRLSAKKTAKKLAYIIATRCPSNSTELDVIKAKIWRSHKLDLDVKTMKYKVSIEKLLANLAS